MYELDCLKVALPEDIRKMKDYGDFDGALQLIELWLSKDLPRSLRGRLTIEKDLIPVLKRQYPYSFDEAYELVKGHIEDFTKEELKTLQMESAADWIYKNGQVYFQTLFYDNLLKTRPDIASRTSDCDVSPETKKNLLDDAMKKMKQNGSLGYHFRIKATLRVKDEAFEPGKTLKVFLPVPKEAKQIDNIRIIGSEPSITYTAPADAPARTVYFEEVCRENHAFSVEYSFDNRVEYVDLDSNDVKSYQPTFHIEEKAPHILFTPYVKELAKELSGNETNPLRLARRFYDFVTTKVKYSYVRDYFTLENIVEYAALNLKGDCGVQALLFITLCRLAGIPARWQSGLYVTPGYAGSHDWAQFYVEPFGWLYADCSFGGSAYRAGQTERWEFYFGNLDPFRMVANSSFQCGFDPKMQHLRMDPYDNQTGECEYEDHAIASDMVVKEIEVAEVYELHNSQGC